MSSDLSTWNFQVISVLVGVFSRCSGLITTSKLCMLLGHSELLLGLTAMLFVSVLPCDGLATHPRCTLSIDHCGLEHSAPPQALLYGYIEKTDSCVYVYYLRGNLHTLCRHYCLCDLLICKC